MLLLQYGGTVFASLSNEHWHASRVGHPFERFEAGTLPFLEIVAVKYGLDRLNSIGMDTIEIHTYSLTQRLYENLSRIRHSNGNPVVEIYGKHLQAANMNTEQAIHIQGDVVTFNLLDKNKKYLPLSAIEDAIEKRVSKGYPKIHLRTGCMCNPGACDRALHFDNEAIKEKARISQISCGDDSTVQGKPYGAIRLSLGYVSTAFDISRFIEFIEEVFVQ